MLKILLLMLILLTISINSYAFHAELVPSELHPGDAFLVRVTGTSSEPAALFSGKQLYFTSCGRECFVAIGAVDIERSPDVYNVSLKAGDESLLLGLNVKYTAFAVLRFTLSEAKVSLSPKDLQRADKEAERLNAIWLLSSAKLWDRSFIMPLENPKSTAFGTKRIINGKKISIHRGLDIKGREGEDVKASNKGRVVLAEELFFGGNTIILDHGQGIYTIYMHLSAFNTAIGDIVPKGAVVGFVGSTGRASGPHLHFGVKLANINTNPDSFVKLSLP